MLRTWTSRSSSGIAFRGFPDLIDPRLRGSPLQPQPQFLNGGRPAVREHLDGTVRQIAGDAAQTQPLGLEPSTVTKIHALNFSKDEKPAGDLVHSNPTQCGRVVDASGCCAFALASAAAA